MPASDGEVSPTKVLKARTQHDVAENLVVGHLDVTDSNTQAEDLLELELDSGADLGQLDRKVLSVGHGGRELASCRKS